METRNSWGVVYVAVFFALVIVGVAYMMHRPAQEQKTGAIATVTQAPSDQQSLPEAASADSSAATPAPSLSGTLAQDAYAGYMGLAQQGTVTDAEKNQMLADVVKKDIPAQNIVPQISTADLTIVATTSVDSYLGLVAVILNQSTQIKQSEPYVFSTTVQNQITTGTPALINDANLYQRIAQELFVMEVPPAVASQHVELVKSVAALSNAVRNMGQWKGDPIEALSEVDAYNKARAYVENSASLVSDAVSNLKKS